MAKLLDRPSEDQLLLLRIIASGYAEAGSWPVWQWVAGQVRDQREDLDPDQVIEGLPTWQHSYRAARTPEGAHPLPAAPGHRVALTAVGMHHAPMPGVQPLLTAVVTAAGIASELQAAARPPRPTEAIRVSITGADLTRRIEQTTGVNVEPDTLLHALRLEPYLWGGLAERSAIDWDWDLTTARLRPFLGVKSSAGYLSRLDPLVAHPEVLAAEVVLPAGAIAEALDHLSLAWRLATNSWLLRVRRCSSISTLSEPVSSAAEFYAACSALADAISSFELPGEGGSLGRLDAELRARLAVPGRALEGVDLLRHVVALRAGQQHSGRNAAERADRARAGLGLGRFASDWARAWEHVRAVTVRALRTVREEVETLIRD